jgi:hypothetical protein
LTEIHTASSSVLEPNSLEVEISIGLKRRKAYTPGTGKIPAQLIQVRGKSLRPEIRKLTNSFWNKEGLPQQCRESVTLSDEGR